MYINKELLVCCAACTSDCGHFDGIHATLVLLVLLHQLLNQLLNQHLIVHEVQPSGG